VQVWYYLLTCLYVFFVIYLLNGMQVLLTNGSGTTSCHLLSRLSTSLICSAAAAAGISFIADRVLIKMDAASVTYSSSSYHYLPDPVITSVLPERGVYRFVFCLVCWPLLPRDPLCVHMCVRTCVCLSVCLSLTTHYYIETAAHRADFWHISLRPLYTCTVF